MQDVRALTTEGAHDAFAAQLAPRLTVLARFDSGQADYRIARKGPHRTSATLPTKPMLPELATLATHRPQGHHRRHDMEKKYELTEERNEEGLYRIRALRDFGDVQEGDLGGWVEGEHNLLHDGLCWIYKDAQVFGNAKVSQNAMVIGNARVYGNAQVFGDAVVFEDARVYGNAQVFGVVYVSHRAWVCGGARVSGAASVGGNALVCGSAWVKGNARVCGDADVFGNACLSSGYHGTGAIDS